MTSGGSFARTVPSSGIVTWNSASSSSRYPSNSSSARSISSMSRTAGRDARRIDRLQQRALDQERIAIELAMRLVAAQLAGGIEDAQLQQLPRVVPLVDGVADVEALVALQPNQVGAERRGRRGGQRGLADAGLAFQKERPSQPQRQKQRHRQALVGHVVVVRQPLSQVRK